MKRKPYWLKTSLRNANYIQTEKYLEKLSLHTVCQEAHCPNQNECFSRKTAAFMILGNQCTRNCTFCAVQKSSTPLKPDPDEPSRIGNAVRYLSLSYVVVTSVTRDDLPDFGSNHFALTIDAIKDSSPSTFIEVLIPDFNGCEECLKNVARKYPRVINHNIETVLRLYPEVRSMADYQRSLNVLKSIKKHPNILSKSGFMLGLGEKREEVIALMKDLRKVNCDLLTIGQYLQPTLKHHELVEFVKPEQFLEYKNIALEMGFKNVVSSPLARSSYHASDIINLFG